MNISNKKIHVVHFSAFTSEQSDLTYPADLRNVIDNPNNFCLSCSAFTWEMLMNPQYKSLGEIGLILEVSLNTSSKNTCCDLGTGNIRAVSNSDLGKLHVCGVVNQVCLRASPCQPETMPPNESTILSSICGVESYNEWIVKPPHKIVGVYLENCAPKVRANSDNAEQVSVTVDRIRRQFSGFKIWVRDKKTGLRKLH